MPNYNPAWDDVGDARIARMIIDTGYSEREIKQAHIEVFTNMADAIELDNESDREYYFSEYLHAMVIGDLDRDIFFEDFGIDPRNFDWDGWRLAMGYV